jgi:ribosomal protein S12 methylthiotransferase accessory factor
VILAADAARYQRDDLLAEIRRLRSEIANRPSGAPAAPVGRLGLFETLAAIEPHLPSLGITRIGDLTGLDVVGVPVFAATRPNSRALSVCHGKGMCAESARLGAIMEAVEQALAERHEDLVSETASPDEMARRGLRCIDPSEVLRSTTATHDAQRKYGWVAGLSMTDEKPVYVPFELAGFDLRVEMDWDHATYKMSTVGLGAGTTLADAALHALLEVVENDASALVDVFGQLAGFARPVAYRPGHHDRLDDLVARVRSAGFDCFFADVTGRVALPTVAAYVTTPGDIHAGSGMRGAAGFACRLSPGDAALAALLEAVQSRLTQIAGARDDLSPDDYAQRQVPKRLAGNARFLDELPRPEVSADATPADMLGIAIATILRAGARDIVLVPLGGVANVACGVRALVPALQAAAGHGVVRISIAALDALWSKETTSS